MKGLRKSKMKKLLNLKTPKEFWKVFSQERAKIIQRQRKLPFLKKLKMLEKMDKLIISPNKTGPINFIQKLKIKMKNFKS